MLNHIPHHLDGEQEVGGGVGGPKAKKDDEGRSVGRLLGGIFIVIQQRGETPLHRRPPTHHHPLKKTHTTERASEKRTDDLLPNPSVVTHSVSQTSPRRAAAAVGNI